MELVKAKKIRVSESKNLREFVFSQRAVKSDFEVHEMETAIGICKRALGRTVEGFSEGMTAEGMSRTLDKNMLDEGGTGPSFDTTVWFRRNLEESAVRKLARGDLVLFDFGTKLPSMYLSDVGRTIPFATGDQKTRDFLERCLFYQTSGTKIASGKSGNEVRSDIDQIIREHGCDSTHRPGHQIGLNVHESFGPALAYGEENSGELCKGNIVTWEPGLGLPKYRTRLGENRYGMIHMEDMVLVGNPSRMLGNFKLDFP